MGGAAWKLQIKTFDKRRALIFQGLRYAKDTCRTKRNSARDCIISIHTPKATPLRDAR